ncbi:MAG: hypothetical protein LC122_14610 [Chitinophagales bacterium]|nr:hypothetical protein [Chitinophagales bacterium]
MTTAPYIIVKELLQENWHVASNSSSVTNEAKVSYLMVEEINPPEYMWSRICEQLDIEDLRKKYASSKNLSNKTIIALLITGSIITIAATLLMLL